VLALLAGLSVAAAAGDWWDVSATQMLGVAVVTIGVGIVAGVFRRGGARGLVPLGIVAMLALIPVSALDGVLDDGVGDRLYRPTDISELQDRYQLGIGELTVDLSAIDFAGESRRIDIDLGIGHALLILPADVGGRALLDTDAGELQIDVPGYRSASDDFDGINVDSGTVTLAGEDGDLVIDFHVGLGLAELDQLAPTAG
jgi:hypothetical protein